TGCKVEPGEPPEGAWRRELHEVLHRDISAARRAPFACASHAYESFHLLMPHCVCRRWDGQPQPREGQAMKWVRPSRMRALEMPPADLPLVAQLRDLLS